MTRPEGTRSAATVIAQLNQKFRPIAKPKEGLMNFVA